jgi:hypothetical protein
MLSHADIVGIVIGLVLFAQRARTLRARAKLAAIVARGGR